MNIGWKARKASWDRWLVIFPVLAVFSGAAISGQAAPAHRKAPRHQQICLPETDPHSLRHTALKSSKPDDEIVRTDVDHDGDPDILERWVNGFRVRWFDENDDMTFTDFQGDLTDDSVQIDKNGDGYYDGPGDINLKYVDDNLDGMPELQVVSMNPNTDQPRESTGNSHYMIFEDVDHDGVFGCLNWQTFEFSCWETDDESPNFHPDYNGDSVFLKVHEPAWVVKDPRYNWENPFAFIDTDGDGVTEMAARICDNPGRVFDSPTSVTVDCDGIAEESYLAWDLDNDTGRLNEMDYDMSMRFAGGKGINYRKDVHPHPQMKAPDWVLPYFRYTNWRQINELIYVPQDQAAARAQGADWGSCYFTFDEDDDDHRWERVEIYYPDHAGKTADPYVTTKWNDKTPGISSHPQADTLGDRGEWDEDYSGKGQLYVGAFDGKFHLFGAEKGAWTVDLGGKYWGGSGPARGNASPDRATTVGEVIQYADTDNNGFFDKITYDYDGDRKIDLTVDLKALGGDTADRCPVMDPATLKWEGMHRAFEKMADQDWADAMTVYRAAWKAGFIGHDQVKLSVASSVQEKYIKAYRLREEIFRKVYASLEGDDAGRKDLMKANFLGSVSDMVHFLSKHADKGGQ